MRRLYNACTVCYVFSVFTILGLSYATIRYFPQKPVYNICNDAVAWSSLINTMASMKVSADFEILASVANPNYLDVALDMGKGSFSHNNAFVGTFDIPPVTVASHAITDILIVAHFMPEKWEALALTAEYYRGKLVLNVDATATIRIPALADYTFPVKFSDLRVNVNEKSDRTFCACPTWNDEKKKITLDVPMLTMFKTEEYDEEDTAKILITSTAE
jgi:hypothetical protein